MSGLGYMQEDVSVKLKFKGEMCKVFIAPWNWIFALVMVHWTYFSRCDYGYNKSFK